MESDATASEKRPFTEYVMFAGLIVSLIAGFVILALYLVDPRLITDVHKIALAFLGVYWLAGSCSYLLSNHSGLRAHTPAIVREAVRWLVIALSFLLAGAVAVLWVVLRFYTAASGDD